MRVRISILDGNVSFYIKNVVARRGYVQGRTSDRQCLDVMMFTRRNFCSRFSASGSRCSETSLIHIRAPRYSLLAVSICSTVKSMSLTARYKNVVTSWQTSVSGIRICSLQRSLHGYSHILLRAQGHVPSNNFVKGNAPAPNNWPTGDHNTPEYVISIK